ncbi:MAG: sigma-70 family RNA polymerase sigma factor [Gemmataceae bacterium]|nr:sigma-70 family RNA polymerase sigma factor [Gemmataceae bacterium]
MTDRQLLDRFLAARDEEAFAELVRRHAPGVWGACRRRLAHVQDAEDAFQAAFLVLVRRAGRLRAGTPLGPWLGKVAALTARNVARGNRRRAAVTGPMAHDIPAATAAEPAVDLDVALRDLPEADRTAVVLCHLDGLTRKEAAERLGCPEGTLSARLSRALGKLRRRLADEVPPGLVRSTVRTAVVFGVASGPAGVSPAVAQLAEEAIRMLWVKKLTAAGLVLAAAGVVGLGVVRTADAGGQDKGPAAAPTAKAAKPADDLEARVRELEAALRRSQAENQRLRDQAAEVNKFLGDPLAPRGGMEKMGPPAVPAKPDPKPGPPAVKADEPVASPAERVAELERQFRDANTLGALMEIEKARLSGELGRLRGPAPGAPRPAAWPPTADPVIGLEEEAELADQTAKVAEHQAAVAARRRDAARRQLEQARKAAGKEIRGGGQDLKLVVLGDESAKWAARYQLTERTGGKPVFYLTPSPEGLTRLLTRAKADPRGPKTVIVQAEEARDPEHIRAAFAALKAAGFERIDYDGPGFDGSFISPGPGTITPGKKPGDPGTFSGPIDLPSLKLPPAVEKK